MLRLLTIFALAISTPAAAIEVGDVVFLSKGAGLTITSVRRVNRETVAMTGTSMEANAAEYCERYEDLKMDSPKWKDCIKENVSATPTTITVNCRTATIILTGGAGAGSYRRRLGGLAGAAWSSVANPNWIIVGDEAYDKACKRH